MKAKLLFVCARNQWRSPTAELSAACGTGTAARLGGGGSQSSDFERFSFHSSHFLREASAAARWAVP